MLYSILFKSQTNVFLVIAGSHVGMMSRLQERQAPLYGRFTAQLPVGPLPFSALAEFFPKMTAAERVGVYAIFGGVPACLRQQAIAGILPFHPQIIGAHWSKDVQVDVVAVNWRTRQVLLGECKWGVDAVPRSVVRELIEEKTPRVLKGLPDAGAGWTVHYAFFARAGLTTAAQEFAAEHASGVHCHALLVDLTRLDRDLSGVS